MSLESRQATYGTRDYEDIVKRTALDNDRSIDQGFTLVFEEIGSTLEAYNRSLRKWAKDDEEFQEELMDIRMEIIWDVYANVELHQDFTEEVATKIRTVINEKVNENVSTLESMKIDDGISHTFGFSYEQVVHALYVRYRDLGKKVD